MSDRPIVLVVDDEPSNLMLVSNLLKERYQVKTARTGAKALQIAASEPRPRLILLDVMMPEMDGFQVIAKLKGDAATASIPVVFLTGKVTPEDEQQGMQAGAIGYLTKPVEADRLEETLDLVFSLGY